MVKALIVEDEPALRDLYGRVLMTSGYDVTFADDGIEAIEILESDSAPNLMILDIRMPHCGGYEVLAYLQTHPHINNMHVVIATATRSFESYAKMIPSSEFLLKPVLPSQLKVIAQRMQSF